MTVSELMALLQDSEPDDLVVTMVEGEILQNNDACHVLRVRRVMESAETILVTS